MGLLERLDRLERITAEQQRQVWAGRLAAQYGTTAAEVLAEHDALAARYATVDEAIAGMAAEFDVSVEHVRGLVEESEREMAAWD